MAEVPIYDLAARSGGLPLVDTRTADGLKFTIFDHRGDREVSEQERFLIQQSVLHCARRQVTIKNPFLRNKRTIALASYPLVNLYDSEIDKRCKWTLIRDGEDVLGVVLEYRGSHNDRIIPIAPREITMTFIADYLNHPETMRNPSDFRPVLPVSSFPHEELKDLLGNEWGLRDGKAQRMIRMAVDQNSYQKSSKKIKLKGLPYGWIVRPLTDEDIPSINSLLESNYKQHSFRSPKYHHGVIDYRGEVIAMSGVIGFAAPHGLSPIALTGDLATRKGFEGHDYAKHARKASLDMLFTEENPFLPVIVVSDANERSVHVNERFGYKRIKDFWWAVFKKKFE